MIARYTREEMGRVWSDANKFARWLEVEIAAADTLAEAGQIPKQAAAAIRQRSQINVARIDELEAKVKHDVIAFTMAVGESIGDPEAARWLHYGLTSNDVVDTAQALQVREASRLIEHGLVRFGEVLERRAHEFQHTPQIGRTHGIHAEPITFGLKIANWYSENRRNLLRFGAAAQQMAVGKISGAVGNCAHLGPEIEAKICRRLGLETAAVTSQVIQRDRHAQYLAALAVIAASLEKIALEIRHLQRTEVREAEEPFAGEQRGSSAMPHKRNPVSCEQICGLARVVRANAMAALENIALWHERDIDRHRCQHARLSRADAAQPGVHARPGVFRAASARPGGTRRAARRRLPVGPGKRDGRLGNRLELSRARCERCAHREIHGQSGAGENLRSPAAASVRGCDFCPGLFRKSRRGGRRKSVAAIGFLPG